MKTSRRLFLGACAALPGMATLKANPLFAAVPGVLPSDVPLAGVPLAGAPLAGVGEVWGLAYWARGATAAPCARRRPCPAPPAWHPEFP